MAQWQALPILNQWSYLEDRVPGFRVANGFLYLRGVLVATDECAWGQDACVLPEGARLPHDQHFAHFLTITADGYLRPRARFFRPGDPDAGRYFPLDGFAFPLHAPSPLLAPFAEFYRREERPAYTGAWRITAWSLFWPVAGYRWTRRTIAAARERLLWLFAEWDNTRSREGGASHGDTARHLHP